MSILDRARRVHAAIVARRNGVPGGAQCAGHQHERNELHEESPPALAGVAPGGGNERNELDEESPPPYLLVTDRGGLAVVVGALDEADAAPLDLETTGLDPRQDKVRLLTLGLPTIDGGWFAYLIDCFAVDPAPVLEALAGKDLVGCNLTFDLGFLDRLGFAPSGKVHDLMHLSRVLYASADRSAKHGLDDIAGRELGVTLDKTHQKADWSGTLTPGHLEYAARDVLHLPAILASLRKKLKDAGLERTAEVETKCLPAVAWMASRGVGVDRPAWEALAGTARGQARYYNDELDRLAPPRAGELIANWKWTSPVDVKALFHQLGFPVKDADADTLAQVEHPIVEPYLAFREHDKRVNSFGSTWLRRMHEGRIYPDWKQTGAVTGRMSCSNPNLQQMPRDKAYRRCVTAPPGRVLVKADYSQVELRAAARIAEDERMIEAYRRGDDLHTLTAQTMTGRGEVTKQERQLAKPVNFGLIYGLSAKTLRAKAKVEYGVDMTLEQANAYREAFFATYRGIARWHQRLRSRRSPETRTLLGRRVLVDPAKSFYGSWANYAVQGTCGDGTKRAMGLLWERRGQVPGAFLVMQVHDELVVEADADQAGEVRDWLVTAMKEALADVLAPVPVEVEVEVGINWSGDQAPASPAA